VEFGVPAAIRPVDRKRLRSEWVPRSPPSGMTETRRIGSVCPKGWQIEPSDARLQVPETATWPS